MRVQKTEMPREKEKRLAHEVSGGNENPIVNEWTIGHSCCILATTTASLSLCPENLKETGLKNRGLNVLVEEIFKIA